MKYVICKYASGYKEYVYKTYLEDLVEDDLVVVKNTNGVSLATVVSVSDTPDPMARCFVFQKVDKIKIEHIEKVEAEKSKVLTQLKERRKKIETTSIYEQLAMVDSEMARLLMQYKSLDKMSLL